MEWAKIEPWDYIAVSVSSEYHKKFPMIEIEDIKQSLYEWFVEHPRKLAEWESIGPKDAKNLIYRSLRNQALDYCQKWKAKSVGYDVSDLYYYDGALVELLLPSVLLGIDADIPKLNLGMPGKPPAPAEGGNMMAMLIEIDSAYHKLSMEDRAILFHKYAESMSFAEIASLLTLPSEDAARMRCSRAIKKLINKMGGFKPYLDTDPDIEPVKESDEEVPPIIPHDGEDDGSDE